MTNSCFYLETCKISSHGSKNKPALTSCYKLSFLCLSCCNCVIIFISISGVFILTMLNMADCLEFTSRAQKTGNLIFVYGIHSQFNFMGHNHLQLLVKIRHTPYLIVPWNHLLSTVSSVLPTFPKFTPWPCPCPS